MTDISPVELTQRLFRLYERGLSLRLCGDLSMSGDPVLLAKVEALTETELANLNHLDDRSHQ